MKSGKTDVKLFHNFAVIQLAGMTFGWLYCFPFDRVYCIVFL